MENIEWKCEHEIITLDITKRQIVRCNITDNPHESFESYALLGDRPGGVSSETCSFGVSRPNPNPNPNPNLHPNLIQ